MCAIAQADGVDVERTPDWQIPGSVPVRYHHSSGVLQRPHSLLPPPLFSSQVTGQPNSNSHYTGSFPASSPPSHTRTGIIACRGEEFDACTTFQRLIKRVDDFVVGQFAYALRRGHPRVQ